MAMPNDLTVYTSITVYYFIRIDFFQHMLVRKLQFRARFVYFLLFFSTLFTYLELVGRVNNYIIYKVD